MRNRLKTHMAYWTWNGQPVWLRSAPECIFRIRCARLLAIEKRIDALWARMGV